jgi:hypothetical protein
MPDRLASLLATNRLASATVIMFAWYKNGKNKYWAFISFHTVNAPVVLNLVFFVFFFRVNDTSHLMLWHPALTAHGVGRSN